MKKGEKIFEGIVSGDEKILMFCYKNYYPSIEHFIKRNNGSKQDAEDLFQEALITIHINPPNNFICDPKIYIFSIVKNRWLMQLKKNNKEAIIFIADTEADDEKKQINEEKIELYKKHFFELGETCKKLLQLHYNNIPNHDIAKNLNLSENYVKKRISMCKKQLIENIQKDTLFKKI